MRTLELTRTEGEWLIDLLEETKPEGEHWRRTMADELRRKFGCVSYETEQRIKADLRVADARTEGDVLDLLVLALPYVEEGEQFNKPDAPKLSKRIRDALKNVS